MVSYLGIVHKDKGSDYGVSFPDFPGCVTAGKTVEEAYSMAKEALQFHIEGMVEDSLTIPSPMAFEAAKKHEFADGLVATFILEVAVPSSAKRRINVMIDEDVLEAIDSKSHNRSAWLGEAAREKLSRAG